MTIDQLRTAARARSFRPFTVCLTDGRKLAVPHPECLAMSPQASRTFIIAGPAEDYRVVDLLHVITLDFAGAPEPSGSGGNGAGERTP